MPLLRNKFQPYFPDPDSPSNYNCGDEQYCHPIQPGDLIKTQFYQTPCGQNEITDPFFEDFTLGAEELTNGTFTGNANGWVTAGGALPSNGWAYDSNNIRHTTGTQLAVYQTGLALTAGFYQIEIDITRTSGSVRVKMGDGGGSAVTDYFEETGTYTRLLYYSDTLDQVVQIEPNLTDDFDGTINSISVKEITYNAWTPTQGWSLNDGYACHTSGYTNILEESVADYIVADQYYEMGITVTGYVSGTCDVYVADALVGTISANGTFYYYGNPTVTGVVSFTPSTDFVACLDFLPVPDTEKQPGLYELKDNHLAYLVDPDGVTEYEIGQYFTYYERWVTLIFDINDLELPYDCYTIKVVDACVVEGLNMVTNSGFNNDGEDWTAAQKQISYSNPTGELQLIYDPIVGTDYITNGDFATGDFTGWTAGAGWSVVANKARHTPGSTATLLQSVTVPVRQAAPTQNFWNIEWTISNRTAGSISITLEDKTKSGYSANDAMMDFLLPTNGGTVDFYITPTSDFDGDIDDIRITYSTDPWNSVPASINVANTNMIAGNYEISFEITAQSDPLIAATVRIAGQSGSFQWFNTVGVHTISVPNYVPGGQYVTVYARFEGHGTGTAYGIPGTINIDNVEVYPVEPFEATYTSECLKYGESFPNTKMLVGYCDQEAFGFEFTNSGFTLQQRALIRSIAPTYPTTSTIQKSGTGNARVTYAEVEKFWEVHTAFASETFHDAMAVIIRCDHFLIGLDEQNGTEYIVNPDDYTPEWIRGGVYSLAPAVMIVRIKDGGQVFNRHF